jgi:hypothetical protein
MKTVRTLMAGMVAAGFAIALAGCQPTEEKKPAAPAPVAPAAVEKKTEAAPAVKAPAAVEKKAEAAPAAPTTK